MSVRVCQVFRKPNGEIVAALITLFGTHLACWLMSVDPRVCGVFRGLVPVLSIRSTLHLHTLLFLCIITSTSTGVAGRSTRHTTPVHAYSYTSTLVLARIVHNPHNRPIVRAILRTGVLPKKNMRRQIYSARRTPNNAKNRHNSFYAHPNHASQCIHT